MRISFQTTDTSPNVEKWKMTDKESRVQKIGTGTGYTLDISGTVANNEIYKGQGKTSEEVMQEAGMQDVALTRDYMAVMSNSMSDEEFAKLQEEGYQPGDMEIENAVTIVDEIKASLIQAGVSIHGYTDTLDAETLIEITGSASLAQEMTNAFAEQGVPLTEETAREAMQALEEAENLTQPGDEMLKYMVANEKAPVIEDFYMAQYSSRTDGSRQGRGYYQDENGYLSRKADSADMESLQPQIDKILEEAGLTEKDGAMDAAKWLIEEGLPLTKESLSSYMELAQVTLPMQQSQLLQAMADAVSDGKSPKQANLTGAGSLWKQAADVWKRLQKVSDEAADLTTEQGKTLTLQHLEEAQLQIENGNKIADTEHITARRQLEEVRLQMTIAANRELLKSGYAIETTQLEELVEALKNVEKEQNQILFCGNSEQETQVRAQLYTETLEIVSRTWQMPLATVGKVCMGTIADASGSGQADFTLKQTDSEGEALKAAYQKAGERYETFRTMPDSELGDSIKKAFRNAEVLLEELELEATESNLRAVRILGYNHLDITKENIMTVKAADQELANVAKKLTPAATLQMIRDEKNPLTMTVAELDDYLSGQQQESGAEQEKFSKFLYKLEQKKEISEEEKEAYIGIYRLMRQVEKTDGAVIGSLLHQGAELSFKNLLSAVRTYRAKPIDTVVDDNLGVTEEVLSNAVRIDEQIEGAFSAVSENHGQISSEQEFYKRLSHEVYDRLDGDAAAKIMPDMDMKLEEFAQQLREAETDEISEQSYRRQQIEAFRKAPDVSAKQIEFLRMLEEPVTFENLMAAEGYEENLSKAFMKIRKEADKYNSSTKNRFQEAALELEEQFESREEATAAYESLAETEKQILEDAMFESGEITSLDVKEMGLVYKQISFAAKLAATQRYEIPVITENSVMALHLQIVHSEEGKGSVEISMNTESYGKLSVRLQLQEEKVNGLFVDFQKENKEIASELKDQIETELVQNGFEVGDRNTGLEKEGQSDQTSTKELYRAAKTVIRVIRRRAEERG